MITRLSFTFDEGRLLDDLALCDHWVRHNTTGWSCLPLRSRGGMMTDVTNGAGGVLPWSDTPLLRRCVYFREVLGTLEAGYRIASARVSALAPGGEILFHRDADSPHRIHVPIITNALAALQFDDTVYQWLPGEAWFADFGVKHRAWNRGSERRVHLLFVLD